MKKLAYLNTFLILIFLISCGPPVVVKEDVVTGKKPLIDKEQQKRRYLVSLRKSRELKPEETNVPEAYDYFKLAEKGNTSFVFLGSSDDTSISYLKKAIELDPYYHAAHYCLALSYKRKKVFANAIKELYKAIEIKPLFSNAYFTLAEIYKDIGNTEKEIDQYKKVLEIEPDNWYAHSGLGYIYEESGNYEEALTEFEKANRLCKGNFALIPMARLYRKLEKFDEAILAYQRLIESDPQDTSHRFWLAYSYSEAGLRHLAIAVYKNILEIEPDNPEANYNIGYNLLESNRKEDLLEAIKYFNASISASEKKRQKAGLKFDAKQMIDLCIIRIEDIERPERLAKVTRLKGDMSIIAKLILIKADYDEGNNLFISGREKTKPIKSRYGDYVTDYDVSPEIYQAQEYFNKFKEDLLKLKSNNLSIIHVIDWFLKAATNRIEGTETYSKGYYILKKDYKGEFEKGFAKIRMADNYFMEGLKLLKDLVKKNPKVFNKYDATYLELAINYYNNKYKQD